MKRAFVLLAVLAMAAPAMGDYYVAGDFNGWDAAANIMTDMGGGIWSVGLTLGANERHEFKVTQGDWGWNVPGSGNSWFLTDGSGNVNLTYDTNVYGDGWSGDGNRFGVDVDPGTWTAVGDWQGWNNADATTAMTLLGGGGGGGGAVYFCQQTLAPGWYQYKAVMTGSWDAIGADARSVNADTWWFETTADRPTAQFYVNATTGCIKVETVPEPSSLLALVAGLPVLAALRRRR